jgi:hypothetical protein
VPQADLKIKPFQSKLIDSSTLKRITQLKADIARYDSILASTIPLDGSLRKLRAQVERNLVQAQADALRQKYGNRLDLATTNVKKDQSNLPIEVLLSPENARRFLDQPVLGISRSASNISLYSMELNEQRAIPTQEKIKDLTIKLLKTVLQIKNQIEQARRKGNALDLFTGPVTEPGMMWMSKMKEAKGLANIVSEVDPNKIRIVDQAFLLATSLIDTQTSGHNAEIKTSIGMFRPDNVIISSNEARNNSSEKKLIYPTSLPNSNRDSEDFATSTRGDEIIPNSAESLVRYLQDYIAHYLEPIKDEFIKLGIKPEDK